MQLIVRDLPSRGDQIKKFWARETQKYMRKGAVKSLRIFSMRNFLM